MRDDARALPPVAALAAVSLLLFAAAACRSVNVPRPGQLAPHQGPNGSGGAPTPAAATPAPGPARHLAYPEAKTVEAVDVYHGIKVRDPYRWLEDPDSPETRAWVEAENRVTFDFLGRIPEREGIRKRLTELWNYERWSLPWKEGGRYFWTRNDGLQNQAVLYTATRLDAEPRVLLDPNGLSVDGTVALGGTSVSRDGRYLAWATQAGGSDWMTWKVREIETGKDLPDLLEWSKFSGAEWTKDSAGFFYSRYDAPKPGGASAKLTAANEYHRLFYHRLGTPQSTDTLVYERPDDKELYVFGTVSDDGRWLLVYVNKGTSPKNRIFLRDLEAPGSGFRELVGSVEASYSVVGNVGTRFWVKTDQGAPRGRVVRFELEKNGKDDWTTVIPEGAETLGSVAMLGGNRLVASYLKDAWSRVELFDLDGGRVGQVNLPGIGTVDGFHGRQEETETFYSFSSFTAPPTIFRYDVKTGESALFKQPKVAFDPSLYETRQVFVTSKDGTRVPLFVTARRGLAQDGKNPAWLYGYGGFNDLMTPVFSPSWLAFMEMGGWWRSLASVGEASTARPGTRRGRS